MSVTPRTRMQTTLDILASLVTIIVGIVVVSVVAINWRTQRVASAKSRNAAQSAANGAIVNDLETTSTTLSLRRPTSKLSIVEFADFECPFCQRYENELYPSIKREFVDPGQVDYIIRQYPLERIHPKAFGAAVAASCAAQQGAYWTMRDRLFAHSDKLETTDFIRDANELRLDKRVFESCLSNERGSEIRDDIAEGDRLRVTGTPTLFIGINEANGKIRLVRRFTGVTTLDKVEAAIAGVLAEMSLNRRS